MIAILAAKTAMPGKIAVGDLPQRIAHPSEAGFAILFLVDMKSEELSQALFLLPATVFVLAMMMMKMNRIWSGRFRLLIKGSK